MKQKYQLQTITPVHIGSGEVLNHIDGCFSNGRWYHIDLDKVLEHPATDINALTSEMSRREFRWNRYLQNYRTDLSEFSAYSLPCQQSPETTEIREAIKSVGNRPYIPGSSIKGALRTMLLADIIKNEENMQLFDECSAHLNREIEKRTSRNTRNETPAKKLEEAAFGKDPNHDLLRGLQVSDTVPHESDSLAIEMAWTVTLNNNNQLVQKIENGTEYKNFVEVIQAKQRLSFTLKIDDMLFREREKKALHFSVLQEKTLREIAAVCKFEAELYMENEMNFYDDYGFTDVVDLYDQLIGLNDRLEDGEFMLQTGWGTGYHANTVTSLFTDGDEAAIDLMSLRRRFRLGGSRSQKGQYDEREFPKTRRILYRGQNPIAPLGWVKISPAEE